jgi:hypothetical protein
MDQRATIRKACIAFVLLSSIALLSACGKAVASAAGNQKAQGNDIVIHKSDVTDVATFIPYEAGNVKMEIIAVKAPDGSIRTAFNTCQVCFDSGKGYYVQEGDELVWKSKRAAAILCRSWKQTRRTTALQSRFRRIISTKTKTYSQSGKRNNKERKGRRSIGSAAFFMHSISQFLSER